MGPRPRSTVKTCGEPLMMCARKERVDHDRSERGSGGCSCPCVGVQPDAALVVAGFHTEARFCTGRDVVVEGRKALEVFFGEAFRALALHLTVQQLVADGDGDRVAVELREHVVEDGIETYDCIAAFYEVDGGLLRSAKVYREGSATG